MAELNPLLSLVRTLANFKLHTSNTVCLRLKRSTNTLANFKLHTSNTVCLRLKRSTIWTLWCQLNSSIEPVSGPLHVGTVKSPINTHSTNLTIARVWGRSRRFTTILIGSSERGRNPAWDVFLFKLLKILFKGSLVEKFTNISFFNVDIIHTKNLKIQIILTLSIFY